jgi:hypothetical protein
MQTSARRLRNRSVANLLQMGHCAPTVMQTLLDESRSTAETAWLVRLVAGLPGGIGNTGGECGGMTAPLVLLGLRHAQDPLRDGLPTVIEKGHDFLQRFTACAGAANCRDIRGTARVPLRCVGVVRQASVLCAQALANEGVSNALSSAHRAAYVRLCAHWREQGFHCAHAVFQRLDDVIPVTRQLLDGTAAFVGGTLCTGATCSALTAGVMALGLRFGEVERNRLRVLRMLGTMALGGNAFADKLNAFNKTMNLGQHLAQSFAAEFGSTQCRSITQCDFSTADGVQRYVEGGVTAHCRAIAHRVARRVRQMVNAATQPSLVRQ